MIPSTPQFQPKDEWGGTVSAAKLGENQRASNMLAADKSAADKGTAYFAKVDAYKNSPAGKAEANKRESDRIASLRPNSVEGGGGSTRTVPNTPIRRDE